jgi:hypothetical protein
MEQALCQIGDSSKASRICSLCIYPMRGKGLPLSHIAVCVLTETAEIVLVCRAESPFCAHPDWARRGTGDGELYDLDLACQCMPPLLYREQWDVLCSLATDTGERDGAPISRRLS